METEHAATSASVAAPAPAVETSSGGRTRMAGWRMLCAGLSVLGGALLFVPLPESGRFWSTLADAAHAPFFALLAAVAMSVVPRPRSGAATIISATAVVAALTLFGLAAEVLQQWTGRQASWSDVAANAAGALCGVVAVAAARAPSRRRACLAGVAGLALLAGEWEPAWTMADWWWQWRQRPQLASFETWHELRHWSAREAEIARVAEHATDGRYALKIRLGPGRYPGTALVPPADWSAWSELTFDVWLAGTEPLPLVAKIADARHRGDPRDRFHQRFVLQPGFQQITVRLPITERLRSGRYLDVRRIAMFQLFAVELDRPRILYLDNLRLR